MGLSATTLSQIQYDFSWCHKPMLSAARVFMCLCHLSLSLDMSSTSSTETDFHITGKSPFNVFSFVTLDI